MEVTEDTRATAPDVTSVKHPDRSDDSPHWPAPPEARSKVYLLGAFEVVSELGGFETQL